MNSSSDRSMATVPPAPTEHGELRAEVRSWLAREWDRARPRREFLGAVVDAGWAAPTWPASVFGRDASPSEAAAIASEFARAGAPGTAQDKHNLWANTLLAFAGPELVRQFLRRLLTDDLAMCLLYSEPGAGSDLAAVQTRAERDGDEYVVNGQKVWTSGGRTAEYGMLVARTDWDVPKHAGISFFWFPMRQPGVEVRPLKQITGEAHFNEVFLTDARVPAQNMLGEVNGGWRVLQTALAYERSVMGDVARGPRQSFGRAEEPADGARREQPVEESSPAKGAVDVDLVALARQYGVADDPTMRQDLMRVYSWRQVNKWNAARAKAQLQQGTSSPILSLGKLAMSRILHEGARVHGRIVGAESMCTGEAFPDASDANFLALNAYFTSIGGGTDQIQRNIIGERVLGLPKEPDIDRDVPFREVRKAGVTGRGD
jgi:alkylation response protein AidB-like acyl-CoA dehydrogenase